MPGVDIGKVTLCVASIISPQLLVAVGVGGVDLHSSMISGRFTISGVGGLHDNSIFFAKAPGKLYAILNSLRVLTEISRYLDILYFLRKNPLNLHQPNMFHSIFLHVQQIPNLFQVTLYIQ